FGFTDNITGINNKIIYYRLKVIGKAGEIQYSNVLIVRRPGNKTIVTLMPNPASSYVTLNISLDKNMRAVVSILDKVGKKILTQNENLIKGVNNLTLDLNRYSEGVYAVVIESADEKIIKQLIIVR
ncbi:MAG TPA: T9SS type A sorting domain-containing protein, partial [Ferruginibacter sp.]|nr:T9SS type A sorting domain-containing protein [Ferruginibacter sp.]